MRVSWPQPPPGGCWEDLKRSRVWGLGFRVWGFGFGVSGFRFRV